MTTETTKARPHEWDRDVLVRRWIVALVAAALVLLYAVADMAMARRLLMVAGGGGAFSEPVVSDELDTFTLTETPEGGGVWFGAPRAIRNGDTMIVGYHTGGGEVMAAIVDNATKAVSSSAALYNDFIVDDHSPPSFVVRPDGVIMAAFAYHVGELYIGVGESVGVLPDQFNGVTNVTSQVGSISGGEGYTYASIRYLADEDQYWLTFRYHDSDGQPWLGYSTSDDDGATWSARTLVMPITYHKVVTNGTGRFDFVLSDHPVFGQGDDPDVNTSIYHMYYDGAWKGSDGSSLGTLPLGNTDGTVVYDGTTTKAWMYDIAIDAGAPVVAFATFPGNDGSDHRVNWGRWTSSAWETYEVAGAGGEIVTDLSDDPGQVYYSGGMALDPENPSRMLYSGDTSGSFQVYLAVTSTNGASWAIEPVTADGAKNVRPFGVEGHDGTIAFVWWTGTYTDYLSWSQGIVGAG